MRRNTVSPRPTGRIRRLDLYLKDGKPTYCIDNYLGASYQIRRADRGGRPGNSDELRYAAWALAWAARPLRCTVTKSSTAPV